MATLTANDWFVMGGLNINWFYQFFDADVFNDNVNSPFEDEYHITTSTNEKLSLYGTGFSRDLSDNMVNGTIEKWTQWKWDSDSSSWVEHFSFEGINVSMSDFYAAGQTVDDTDDFALIAAMLSGDDMITLSDDDDTANGYDGNDTLLGKAGADELFGDLGDDTLKGGTGDDNLLGTIP